MLISEARELKRGDQLVTTPGDRVTFVEMGETGQNGGTRLTAAIVDFEDGRREAIPPRSLHRPRTPRTQPGDGDAA